MTQKDKKWNKDKSAFVNSNKNLWTRNLKINLQKYPAFYFVLTQKLFLIFRISVLIRRELGITTDKFELRL